MMLFMKSVGKNVKEGEYRLLFYLCTLHALDPEVSMPSPFITESKIRSGMVHVYNIHMWEAEVMLARV